MLTAIRISIDDKNVNVKYKKNYRCKMLHEGKELCLKTFLMLYAIHHGQKCVTSKKMVFLHSLW